MKRSISSLLVFAFLLVIGVACGPEGRPATASIAKPLAIGHSECAVCGMTVADQPSPRAQVLHRDGKRRFFCSLGDLRAYVQAPSPLGQVIRIWVETLPTDFDPAKMDLAPRSWIDAEEARFVVGIVRPGIMGRPVLSFANEAEAADLAGRLGARIATWKELAETPFNDLP